MSSFFSDSGCLICHGDFPLENGICSQCLSSMDFTPEILGENYDFLSDVYITFLYQNLTQEWIQKMKFQEGKYLAKIFGNFMTESLLLQGGHRKIDAIAYVPMTKNKERIRGYNQGKLLAEEIGRNLNIPILHVLKKKRENKDQIGLTGQERTENVRDVFSCEENLEGRRILLVDDVFTTGATLSSCGKVLMESGAEEVFGLVIAKALYTKKGDE
ncbi:ComF family protein [Peptoniphilus sp. KCTC 25270]|uniref:ComF family protein n=1 Tax=Peptoniphilus sp. KCTC 25270 TaxID=2897414 RepID=UPI001E65864F|nr:ComF family protein [Peptoniphilus sp. KCTC 25270]MCD1147259.1 ComF family protein [Peptoniphilus sp. KCTC 25270]